MPSGGHGSWLGQVTPMESAMPVGLKPCMHFMLRPRLPPPGTSSVASHNHVHKPYNLKRKAGVEAGRVECFGLIQAVCAST